MIYLAALNSNLISFVILGVIVILLGALLRYFKQPYVIAYILAGVLLGKHGFKVLTDQNAINIIGEFGLILLLFFVGMEISIPNLIKNWKVPTIGTIMQILGSILLVGIVGYFFHWNLNHIIVLGFITSLSSSAIVIKLLQDNKENHTSIGQNVISILLMQDILIVPMLIITNLLGGTPPSQSEIVLQIIGGIGLIALMIWILRKKSFTLPFTKHFENDHELQVFIAIIVCFGCATITGLFGLSAALGAFVGGMIVHAAKSTEWFEDSLHSFRVLFVAIFFVSIGMMIDLDFLVVHWKIISLILISVYLTNHFVNAAIIYFFGRNWKKSMYGGALLAQIGELSFILSSTAFFAHIISDFEYQMIIIVISLTLLISPFWISGTKFIIGYESNENAKAIN